MMLTKLMMMSNLMVIRLAEEPEMFTNVMTLLKNGVSGLGGILAVFGAINLGKSIKDSNGPGIASAIAEIVGGGIIIAAATYLGSIKITG